MDELTYHPTIRIKRKNIRLLQEHSEIIYNLFSVRVPDKTKKDECNSNFVYFLLEVEKGSVESLSEIAGKVQTYVDTLCSHKKEKDQASVGEDSSYDSDFEVEESKSHQDISRTNSDTLAAEFAEYVSTPVFNSVNYAAKVEFGLKLGYTEKLVQTALCKLGPNPSQNELLAELIKLGAQSSKISDFERENDEELILDETKNLRPIVIDGSNVAMSHGNKEVFSCKGIKICVDWFKNRGHKEITVFVPKWRKETCRPDNPIADQEILTELEKERIVVFTPSRLVRGKRTICYDDRYILRLAVELDGIVVSNDNYRDLAKESGEFRKVVEERTLMYSFVNDRFMPPDDPLGRSGPTLENFLKLQYKKNDPAPLCPYGKKCTYGNKCKYNHPERGSQPHKSVTERLVEHAQRHWHSRGYKDMGTKTLKGKSLSVPLSVDDQTKQQGAIKKIPLFRTKSGAFGCQGPSFILENEKVSKSKSVDNITNEKISTQASQILNWRPQKTQELPYTQIFNKVGCHAFVTQKLSDPESKPADITGNLHKKLERQLTLNPYDSKMLDMGRDFFKPIEVNRHYYKHQNVTRIASAPDSYCQPFFPLTTQSHMHRLSSTSDPQINLCVSDSSGMQETSSWISAQPSHIYPTVPGQLPLLSPPFHLQQSCTKEEARRKLHYHLASIFPEEQVMAALQLYPEETKPQEICAAILAMFAEQ